MRVLSFLFASLVSLPLHSWAASCDGPPLADSHFSDQLIAKNNELESLHDKFNGLIATGRNLGRFNFIGALRIRSELQKNIAELDSKSHEFRELLIKMGRRLNSAADKTTVLSELKKAKLRGLYGFSPMRQEPISVPNELSGSDYYPSKGSIEYEIEKRIQQLPEGDFAFYSLAGISGVYAAHVVGKNWGGNRYAVYRMTATEFVDLVKTLEDVLD